MNLSLTKTFSAVRAFLPFSQNQKNPPPSISRPPVGTEIIPPFGMNGRPGDRPQSSIDIEDLTQRIITNDPRESWYLALPPKITQEQAEMIKRAALGGDIWQQFQLLQLMLDKWPMLKKCDSELREAVCSVKFHAHPYCEEGEEPTQSAKEKADLVNRCIKNMTPNAFNDERDFKGMLYHLCGAFLNGIVLEELIWGEPVMVNGSAERRPRAAAFVHPRHYTFGSDGSLAVYDDLYNRLYAAASKVGQTPDKDKFICGQFYSNSGSTLGAGFIRPLIWWFCAVIWGQEWMLQTAQYFGTPFIALSYKQGVDLKNAWAFLQKASVTKKLLHPEGTDAKVFSAELLSADNPQRYLCDEADKQCQLELLGQTLTSDSPKSGGGTRAQGEVHMDVRHDRIEGIARWLCAEPLAQFARACVRVNWGQDADEMPTIEADFSKPMDAMERAQFLTAISATTIPLPAEDTYKTLGLSMPEEGDKVIVGGKIGLLGDTETEISANPAPPVMSPHFDANGNPMQLPTENGQSSKETPPANARQAAIRNLLVKASAKELDEMKTLVVKANRPNRNGEVKELKSRLKTLATRK